MRVDVIVKATPAEGRFGPVMSPLPETAQPFKAKKFLQESTSLCLNPSFVGQSQKLRGIRRAAMTP